MSLYRGENASLFPACHADNDANCRLEGVVVAGSFYRLEKNLERMRLTLVKLVIRAKITNSSLIHLIFNICNTRFPREWLCIAIV